MPLDKEKMKPFTINGRTIAPGKPCLVIAEVAQAHDGSLGMAHAYIDAIAAAGADAVKFQTHIAEAESSDREPWRVKFSPQDETRFDYWKRTAFAEDQWQGLKRHAEEQGLLFISSPFSVAAVDLLARIGMAVWKIPSGETANPLLLDRIVATGSPVILSTGMSPLEEIERTAARLRAAVVPHAVLQCTTAYPCPPEKIGLNLIAAFRQQFRCPVGLSDHSGTVYAGLAAAAQGIEILEVHVAFSRALFGPDVRASVTTDELRQLVEGVRFIEKMKAHPVDKEQMAAEMQPLRDTFTQSLCARIDLSAGTVLQRQHLTARKPGIGIPVRDLEAVLGQRLRNDVAADSFLRPEDIDGRGDG